MRVEAKIAGRKERKMGWSTKATIALFGLVIVLVLISYDWSCAKKPSAGAPDAAGSSSAATYGVSSPIQNRAGS